MKIDIKNEQEKKRINRIKIKNVIRKILKLEGQFNAELSILFVNDKKMRKLNYKFRGVDNPTDVLAFSMQEGEDAKVNPCLLGDIVISLETARRYAKKYKTTEKEEIYLYLVHGILHLLGYDDATQESRYLMNKKQKEILARIL